MTEDIYIAGELVRLKKHPITKIDFIDPKYCNSTHGGSGYAIGSFWLNWCKYRIVCGICGIVTEAPSSYKTNPPVYLSAPPTYLSINSLQRNQQSISLINRTKIWLKKLFKGEHD